MCHFVRIYTFLCVCAACSPLHHHPHERASEQFEVKEQMKRWNRRLFAVVCVFFSSFVLAGALRFSFANPTNHLVSATADTASVLFAEIFTCHMPWMTMRCRYQTACYNDDEETAAVSVIRERESTPTALRSNILITKCNISFVWKLISSEKKVRRWKNTYKNWMARVVIFLWRFSRSYYMVTLARNAVHLCVVNEILFCHCEFIIDRIKVRVHGEEMEFVYWWLLWDGIACSIKLPACASRRREIVNAKNAI